MKFSQHLATNILLASILVVLVLIWYRMPAITDTFNVKVRNRSLDVEVSNIFPVPVTIEE
jgi:hypothetical protein